MEAGEKAGVQMPFGCRMGICQSCVVGLVDGYVRDLRTRRRARAGYPDSDLYFVGIGRLCARCLGFTGR